MNTRQRKLRCVRAVGGLFPHELLARIQAGDPTLPGIEPATYHLDSKAQLSEAVNRSWNRLLPAWKKFKAMGADYSLPTGPTRKHWLLPLFEVLGYGRLPARKSNEADGRPVAISHEWNHSPIHLLGSDVNLDRRSKGVTGAATTAPHGLVQEFLNRSEQHMWGFLSNGLHLRILRDNHSLTRQSFIEFDLREMMNGNYYSEFLLLWMLCHQSRVEDENPGKCSLENWHKQAHEEGVRALKNLRGGVEKAIAALGSGFVKHKANQDLRDALQNGNLSTQEFYRQILRLVYRLIFLFAAEDRDMLLDPKANDISKRRYNSYYSTTRLRILATKLRGATHHDLWDSLRLVMDGLDNGCIDLALPALGSGLWSNNRDTNSPDRGCPWIIHCQCENKNLLDAVLLLSSVEDGKSRYTVNWRDIGSEELGGIYESLLELKPKLNLGARSFSISSELGQERKATGSFYTPPELVDCLLEHGLDPVIERALKKDDKEEALLALKICDPACGSGHFLVAAAHRLAKRLASYRTKDDEPSPEAITTAMREIVGGCVFGVDINPMAVELCKVSLWMEALAPGLPLSFLDSHIQCGNAVLGGIPYLMTTGIPDSAFEASGADDPDVARKLKQINQSERRKQAELLDPPSSMPKKTQDDLSQLNKIIEEQRDDEISGIRTKEAAWGNLLHNRDNKKDWFVANAWCAAFFWPLSIDTEKFAITHDRWRQIKDNPTEIPHEMRETISRIARKMRFFHWHLGFRGIFKHTVTTAETSPGWIGGFDVILGNPPWIRHEQITGQKPLLGPIFQLSGTSDLSAYFTAISLWIAEENGKCALLTPNKWLRSGYGASLRNLIRDQSKLDLIIDFGHSTTLFPDANTFPAAFVYGPSHDQSSKRAGFTYLFAPDSARQEHDLRELIEEQSYTIPFEQISTDRWRLEDPSVSAVLEYLQTNGVPLKEHLSKKVRGGVSTGYDRAFVIDAERRRQLIADDESAREIIYPWTPGASIKRWNALPPDEFFVFSFQGIGIKRYSSVVAHLRQFRAELTPKSDPSQAGPGRAPGSYNWYEIRSPIAYFEEFMRPKIFVPQILSYSEFALVNAVTFPSSTVVHIPSDDLALLGILNSRIVWWIMGQRFPKRMKESISVTTGELGNIPIPPLEPCTATALRSWVGKLTISQDLSPHDLALAELVIDGLVIRLYRINDEQLEVIERTPPPRDPLVVLSEKFTPAEFEDLRVRAANIVNTMGHSQTDPPEQ